MPVKSDPSDAIFEPRGGESWRDPFTMYRALRDHDPVHEVEHGDGNFWAISRFEDVLAAATDAETFSSAQGLTFAYGEMEKLPVEAPIVMMDPPGHTALRKVVAKRFTPKRVTALEPMIRSFVVERIEQLRARGEGDVVKEVFKPLPSMVVAHFLGVPQEDRSKFDDWTDAIVAANALGDFGSAASAAMDMMGYFAALIEKRRSEPDDDMISSLVHGEIEGQPISIAQILGFGFTMVTGGNDTTTGLLGGTADLLTCNPDQRDYLADDPKRIRDAIEEFLRLTSPVQGLARMTTRDVKIGGRTIPKDRKVMLLYASANRDQREFGSSAEELDVKRKVKRHLTFSYGPHHCIGAAAARMQARVALEELLTRCPRFAVDGERGQYAGGHFVRRFESLPFFAEGS